MTTTCFDYDGDTLAGEETLPQSGGGGGQPGARRNSSPRGSPTRRAVIANRGGGASRTTLAATAAFSTNAAAFSTTALQNAVQTCAAVSFADPSTGSGSHGARVVLSAATSTLGNLGALGRRDIQNGYVFWDNGPDGTFGQDDEPTGGGGTSSPTTTIEIHDPFGFNADTVSAIGNVILGGVVYDSFGNPLGGGGYGSPSSQDPQPQQDGSLLDPTALRSDSTGNGVSNPGTGTGVEGNDDLGANAGSMADYLRNAFRQGVANLLASAPFQPGSEGRQFFANAMRMVPFAGAAYSGYAAATGNDPIAGTCEGIGPRVLDGFGFAGGLLDVFHSYGAGGGAGPHGNRPSSSTLVVDITKKNQHPWGTQVLASDVTNVMNGHLGNGTVTDLHPRLGTQDLDRLVTQTGPNSWKSIRYGNHEINGTNPHFHLEWWWYDSFNDIMYYANVGRRIQ